MRILLTVPSLRSEFGGPIAKGRALAAALDRIGHEVKLVGAGRHAGRNEAGLPVLAWFHGTPIPLALHRVARAVRDAEVAHVIGYRDPVGTVAALVARRSKVPYLVEPVGMRRRRVRSHMLKAAFDRSLGRRVIGGARLVVATSSREAAELREDGISGARIAIRANGLDLKSLEPLPPRGIFRARMGLDRRAPVVLALARLVRTKGLPFLVEAVARVAGAHVVVAGPDQRDGTLEAVTNARSRLELNGRLHLLKEGLWDSEKLQALVDADVFCLASVTENFGTAAAEAAACGTATIVSDRCGVAEWLGDGVEVVPYGDVQRLAATIERLLQNPEHRLALAERGRAAARKLSWDVIAQQQVELYERVLRSA